MNQEQFNKIFEEVIAELKRKNTVKGDEYSRNNNRLHNFEVGATVTGLHLANYLYVLRSKHEVSIKDMINDLAEGRMHDIDLWKEKITDSIMYMILLYAYIKEEYERISCIEKLAK